MRRRRRAYHTPKQGHQHRQIPVEGRRADVLVHLVQAVQHRPEAVGAMVSIVDRPMAESTEYRPPTQSQNSNMLAVSIPNAATESVRLKRVLGPASCAATASVHVLSRAS